MPRDPQVLSLKISAKNLPPELVKAVRWFAHKLLGFERFNATYRCLPPCQPSEISGVFLDAIRVRTEYSGLAPRSIPASGPLIVIANHPFGIIDGMSLDALLLTRRPDVTVMAVYQLEAIPEFKGRFIFVDPLHGRHSRRINMRGWRQAFHWLARGCALIVFPAGRVARFQWKHMAIADLPWSTHIARLARRTGASVLPVYFQGHNGWSWQIVSMLWPRVQDRLLLGDPNGKPGPTLHATVGQLIEPKELARFSTDGEATEFLRRQTENLAKRSDR
jgi:putative hemolysin